MRDKAIGLFWSFLIILFSISCNNQRGYKVKEINDNINVFYSSNNKIVDSIADRLFYEGMSLVERGDFLLADSVFQLADSLEPENVIILNSIALNFHNLGKSFDSYEIFERAIAIDSTFSFTYSNLAYILNSNGEYRNAIKYLKQGIKHNTSDRKNAVFNYTLAISYYNIDSCKVAKKHIENAISFENDRKIIKEYKDYRKFIKNNCD